MIKRPTHLKANCKRIDIYVILEGSIRAKTGLIQCLTSSLSQANPMIRSKRVMSKVSLKTFCKGVDVIYAILKPQLDLICLLSFIICPELIWPKFLVLKLKNRRYHIHFLNNQQHA